MPPVIDEKKCIRCGLCASICPLDVFSYSSGKTPEIAFPDECWHCNSCVLDCPKQAVSLRIPIPFMLLHLDAEEICKNKE